MMRLNWPAFTAAVAVAVAVVSTPPGALAQGTGTPRRPPAQVPAPRQPAVSVRGFGDVGMTVFTASESFDALFGSASGVVFGGGAEAVLRQGWFFGGRISRVAKDGHRVFVDNGEVFELPIETTVTITPLEFTGGYRFLAPRRRLIPYLGGGIGLYGYREESEFATSAEDVDESFTSYHLLAGAEYRISRLFGIAGEVQWATVPDAIGQEPGSVGSAFDETDLGGATFRAKFVVGL